MASKKKATKKAKKKINSKVIAPTNDLFVEMSSEPAPAVEPAVQAEYTWKPVYLSEETPSLTSVFTGGFIGGAMLGVVATLGVILVTRLFA